MVKLVSDFIQWLFPTRTFSYVNPDAPGLSDADVVAMQGDVKVSVLLIKSYRMMLDFYGMILVNERTGDVTRSAAYRERYHATLVGHVRPRC